MGTRRLIFSGHPIRTTFLSATDHLPRDQKAVEWIEEWTQWTTAVPKDARRVILVGTMKVAEIENTEENETVGRARRTDMVAQNL
jgi:hypothetical protein